MASNEITSLGTVLLKRTQKADARHEVGFIFVIFYQRLSNLEFKF